MRRSAVSAQIRVLNPEWPPSHRPEADANPDTNGLAADLVAGGEINFNFEHSGNPSATSPTTPIIATPRVSQE